MMAADRIEQLENIISGWEGQNPAKAKYAFEKQNRRIEELELALGRRRAKERAKERDVKWRTF